MKKYKQIDAQLLAPIRNELKDKLWYRLSFLLRGQLVSQLYIQLSHRLYTRLENEKV